METILNCDGLSVGYGKKVIIDGITLSLESGELMSVIGPNGAGKSTWLKTLTRRLSPIDGKITFCGKNMEEMSGTEFAGNVSAMMTDRVRTEFMTCRDVVESGRYPHTGILGILSDGDRKAAQNALSLVGAEELSNLDIRCVSDGQRQRVMLARALAQEPHLLILDEPTSFLDVRHKLEFLNLLKKLAREKNISVLMSLHELDLAQRVSDKIVCVRGGHIDRFGTPREIFSGDYISQLFGIEKGTFIPQNGTAELLRDEGSPAVFVIGGGGAGIEIYRELNRKGIPFAVGVIHENDAEYLTACALSAVLISEKAFEPISTEAFQRAEKVMKTCKEVICVPDSFGTMNALNGKLKQTAAECGLLIRHI